MAKSPRVHLICTAHLDPIWQWSWDEGLTEALATFEVAADLLGEFPEFIFHHNESLLYEWVLEYRPELFKRIQRWVKAGRWVISGGWYLQPDCNLPGGESFVRQILQGREFFKTHFGVTPRVAYNLDSFGHHGNMPQILRKSGFEMYLHFRPGSGEKTIDGYTYRWRGVDGTEIPVLRPHGWYCHYSDAGLRQDIELMRAKAAETGHELTVFWGAGDHGGGATRSDLRFLRELIREFGDVRHSALEDYRHVATRQAESGPLVQGELQKIFEGCYTSVMGTKQRNRRGEGLALAAERLSALAWWMLGESYPRDRLNTVWKRVLFNQFHDILPGSSVRHGFQSSIELYGHAFTEARELLVHAQLALFRSRKTRKALACVVFNPQADARRKPVEVEFIGATHPGLLNGKHFVLRDLAGKSVPVQHITPSAGLGDWQQRIAFTADLPALGMAEYHLDLCDGPYPKAKPVVKRRVQGALWRFETSHYSVAINARTGLIESMKARGDGQRPRELMARPGGVLSVREDTCDVWGHQHARYGKPVGRFTCPAKAALADALGADAKTVAPAVRIIEEGPIATRVEVIQTYKRSVARLRYTFYAECPEIGVELLLNWGERKRCLQWIFPTGLGADTYETEIPHASIIRPVDNGEEPAGRWTMLSDGTHAFALANDGPGGVDVRRGELRQTLLRSPVFCTMWREVPANRAVDHVDLGEHLYRFTLRFGDAQTVRAELPGLADDITMPPMAVVHLPLGACKEEGVKPNTDTVRVDGKYAKLAALKQSQDGKALIARVVETGGRRSSASLRVPGLRGPIRMKFEPFEIKTFRIERARRGVTCLECDLLEKPVV